MYNDIDDQQLMELIYRYDSQMSAVDQEYLLQVENREAVVRTLQAKILERDQIGICNENEMYFNQDDTYDTQLYYGEQEIMMEDEREKLGLCHKNL